ncbi:MAG: hypothetical protein GTO14_19210, partial [Anaerolineales bacterium]|nr:hypothetical protein [Anaerolineales bacterium]
INEQTSLGPHIRAKDQVIAILKIEDDGSYTAIVVVRYQPASPEVSVTETGKERDTAETVSSPIETEAPTEEVEFSGIVEAISGISWIIDGQVIGITTETEVEDDIVVGDFVRVHAQIAEDGTLTAIEIERFEVEEDDEVEREGEEKDRQKNDEDEDDEDPEEQEELDEDDKLDEPEEEEEEEEEE